MKRPRKVDHDVDLNEELSNYEPSDSDDEYDDNEKLLLERARKGKRLDSDDDEDDSSDEEEVLGVYSSEDENDETKNADSDIEGMEDAKLPDSKAWGKRKKDFYYTDYVDQDYGGFSKEEEEEAARMEEKEARTLQSRLAAQLDDVDLSMGLETKEDKKDVDEEDGVIDDDEVVKTDLSKLTKREKLALFEKESPEFFGLATDYKERLVYAKEKLFPVMALIKSGFIESSLPCSKFVELKTHLIMNYCTNVAFYLVLKKKRISVKDHPITERLLKYRGLLQQLDSLESSKYTQQLDEILEMAKNNEISNQVSKEELKSFKNKKLKLLTEGENKSLEKKIESKTKKIALEKVANGKTESEDVPDDYSDIDDDSGDDDDDINEPPSKNQKSTEENIDESEDKRAITYEMAKNKGLTPHRKKEQRNPRVKNRNKYRKALIKRKGQVRQVRTEVTKYGGEIFGIKASVVKSRKLKQ